MAQLKILLLLFILCFIKLSVQAPVEAYNAAAPQLDENSKINSQQMNNVPMEGSYKAKSKETESEPKPDDNVKAIVISEKPFIPKIKEVEKLSENVPLENSAPAKDSAKEEKQIEQNPKRKLDDTKVSKDEDAIKENEQSKPKESTQENSVLSPEESIPHLHINKPPFSVYSEDLDIPDSYRMGSYFLVAISSVAIMFIVFKIYRMRLSRAERKYGVQGNRSAQELTPLPMSIDDLGNSDDEDQTLFDRHQIRIL